MCIRDRPIAAPSAEPTARPSPLGAVVVAAADDGDDAATAASGDDAAAGDDSDDSDDDIGSQIAATVSVSSTASAAARMKLSVDVAVSLTAPSDDALTCTVKYWPRDLCASGDGTCAVPPLYARTVALSETAATRSATLSLYRLVAGATYDLSLIHISEPTRPY